MLYNQMLFNTLFRLSSFSLHAHIFFLDVDTISSLFVMKCHFVIAWDLIFSSTLPTCRLSIAHSSD